MQRKPFWLNKRIDFRQASPLKRILRNLRLKTVCEEALCPNLSECFQKKVASFMILGDTCSRNCGFCALKKGRPAPSDKEEPKRIAQAVSYLKLKYVVITSPTRDDLKDKGARVFWETAQEIKRLNPKIKLELLIPDFLADPKCITIIVKSGAEVISHNLETVPSLYPLARKEGNYLRSLEVLRVIKSINKKIFTKSGLILGLGETERELLKVFKDLRKVNCDFLTLGQYLAPSLKHYPVKEYILPERFEVLGRLALRLGFKKVKSSPYTRSSYLAHNFL